LARKEIVYKGESFSVAYDILNFSSEKTIIFLHGWGSNRALMKRVFSPHFSDYRQLYIDIIGFGDSGEPPFPLDSYSYRDIVEIFLREIAFPVETVVGHSFGGKVGTLLKPKNLILLSTAGVIEEKPLSVKLKIALFKLLKIFGFSHLRNLFVSSDGKNLSKNMYETFKAVIREDFREEFRNLKSNTLIFWGEEDRATSLQSGEKIHQLISGSKLYRLHGDHFFFLHHTQFISGEIQKRVNT
jgi:pimeloyl-ACP methyl ester carboxylesterase